MSNTEGILLLSFVFTHFFLIFCSKLVPKSLDGDGPKRLLPGYLELIDDLVLFAVCLQLLLAGVKVVAVLRVLDGVLWTEIRGQIQPGSSINTRTGIGELENAYYGEQT